MQRAGQDDKGANQMHTIYKTTVVKLGVAAESFLDEKMLILFKDNAPEELADYCVLHSGNELTDTIRKGDHFRIGAAAYEIVFVGSEVQKNLRDLGHITLRFNANADGEALEGSLYLEDSAIVPIEPGVELSVVRK